MLSWVCSLNDSFPLKSALQICLYIFRWFCRLIHKVLCRQAPLSIANLYYRHLSAELAPHPVNTGLVKLSQCFWLAFCDENSCIGNLLGSLLTGSVKESKRRQRRHLGTHWPCTFLKETLVHEPCDRVCLPCREGAAFSISMSQRAELSRQPLGELSQVEAHSLKSAAEDCSLSAFRTAAGYRTQVLL